MPAGGGIDSWCTDWRDFLLGFLGAAAPSSAGKGLEQGREQGAYQNKLETGRKLIVRGASPEEIADLTGLTLPQVQSLILDTK